MATRAFVFLAGARAGHGTLIARILCRAALTQPLVRIIDIVKVQHEEIEDSLHDIIRISLLHIISKNE